MVRSTITSKSQTTVPRQVREALGLAPGDTLLWEVEGSAIRVTVGGRGFLQRRGSIKVGPGSTVADVRAARHQRGRERE
jgi:AbrB family looped-hinge helix DNA binding protein